MNRLQVKQGSDLIIVGAGLFGLTVARLAAEDGYRVSVIEKRSHPGGNAWSGVDPETGIEVHYYGSHLFHTSNERVWAFVQRFSAFNNYQHHVLTTVRGRVYRLPINLQTINDFFGHSFSPMESKAFLDSLKIQSPEEEANFETRAKEMVGTKLYESFFAGYSQKQWGVHPSQIPAEVVARLPFRTNYNARYFNDKYEGLPIRGYFHLIENILDHPKIDLSLCTDFFDHRNALQSAAPIVYSGPLDKYFNFVEGQLRWRTLDFSWDRFETEDFQGCAVMNFADLEVPFTRVHEFRHLHPERKYGSATIVAREFSRMSKSADDEPYYPLNSADDRRMLEAYRALASEESQTVFGGRLGSYQYLDMHMAIGSAMQKYESEVKPLLGGGQLLA